LVVDFHALSSSPFGEAYLTQLPKLADAEGFVAVFPRGMSSAPPLGPGYSWNAAACCPYADSAHVDDIGMARELPALLTAYLETAHNVTLDPSRVYAMGMSNGGFMTNRVACEAADIYAAFAPVSGLYAPGPSHLWASKPFNCTPPRHVPLLHVRVVLCVCCKGVKGVKGVVCFAKKGSKR
jgi:polyhydroxybutyrate depolymerase